MHKEIIGDTTLYLGDSASIVDAVVDSTHVVITDPPYGVNYKGSATRHSSRSGVSYVGFDDTRENVRVTIVPIVIKCIAQASRVAMTPGIRCARLYPAPDGEGVFFYPAGANRGPWGFIVHQPIFYYGKCPYLARGAGSMPTGTVFYVAAEKNGHPCPKPIDQMEWLVNRTSNNGDVIVDPFMGSGTTGVAALKLGRKFIGVEIVPEYFEIACERIDMAQRQTRMFA